MGHPGRQARAHRRDDGGPQPRLDADALLRHPGRARHRQGAVPRSGGRRPSSPTTPTSRRTRARRSSSTTSRSRSIVNPMQALGRGRAAHPRRQGEPARQRRLRLGGRRQGRHRPRVRGRPTSSRSSTCTTRGRIPSPLECCGSIADFNRCDVEAHRLHDDAGAAHHPRRRRAGRRAARAHDPDHLPRPRRRLRQQGAGLPGLRRVDPGVDPARASGEVDRGSHRQPDLDRLRA